MWHTVWQFSATAEHEHYCSCTWLLLMFIAGVMAHQLCPSSLVEQCITFTLFIYFLVVLFIFFNVKYCNCAGTVKCSVSLIPLSLGYNGVVEICFSIIIINKHACLAEIGVGTVIHVSIRLE